MKKILEWMNDNWFLPRAKKSFTKLDWTWRDRLAVDICWKVESFLYDEYFGIPED